MRHALLGTSLSIALVVSACSIDALLEGPPTPDTRLAIAVQASEVSVEQGDAVSVDASISRLGDFRGPVEFKVTEVPRNVTVDIGPPTTAGAVTSATITFRVGPTVPAGAYTITIRGTTQSGSASVTRIELRVAPRPAVTLVAGTSNLTIIRGGRAALSLSLVRTAFQDPVAITLVGPAGITATLDADSAGNGTVGGSAARATIAVASGVAAATYDVVLRASAAGVPDSDVPLTLAVSDDPLQLIVDDGSAQAVQASVVSAGVIVNRNGAGGDVVFSIDGLPAGVTPSFAGGEAGSTDATLTLLVAASVEPRAYNLKLHGMAGAVDAVVPFVLTVGASNVALTLVPPSVILLQGTTAGSTLTLIRSAYSGSVGIDFSGVPSGITVVPADTSVTGSSTTLLVTTDTSLAPGTYTVSVRAIPSPSGGAGAPALDPVVTTLTVVVVAPPPGDGNVVLDWSRCTAPTWVAGQDGSGPWTPLPGAGGLFRFNVADRGAFAYVNAQSELVVRYGTAAEFAAAWIDLCPPAQPPTHVVGGTAEHHDIAASNLPEQYTWFLGSAFAVSTAAKPNFAITDVTPGTHDLLGWGVSQVSGSRAFVIRDVPEGSTVGTVSLDDPTNSFARKSVFVTVGGASNEGVTTSVALLTRPACEASVLPGSGGSAFVTRTYTGQVTGFPEDRLRANDYHRLDVSATTSLGMRTLSYSTHALPTSTPDLQPTFAPTVSKIPGSYTRLNAYVPDLSPGYNGTMTFEYRDGTHVQRMTASAAYIGSGAVTISMPELGGVSGFPSTVAVPPGATGTWSMTADGSDGQPMCSEGSTRWTNMRKGTF